MRKFKKMECVFVRPIQSSSIKRMKHSVLYSSLVNYEEKVKPEMKIIDEDNCIPYNEETLLLILEYLSIPMETLTSFMKKDVLVINGDAPAVLQKLRDDLVILMRKLYVKKEKALLALLQNKGNVVDRLYI